MKIQHSYTLLVLLGFIAACSGGSGDPTDNDPQTDDEVNLVPDPSAATLIFPDNNQECNEGEIVDDQSSTVTFQWNSSQNTDNYTITLRNLDSGSSFNTSSTTTQAPITIDRGTPYEWYVVSRANGTNATAQSPTWRFYNEGPGIQNYAPFPAQVVSPAQGANLSNVTAVTLRWEGSDVDDDIVDYEVFFGTDSTSLESLEITTESVLEDVAVSPGMVYFWKVNIRDSQSNVSGSELFQFRVNP